MPEPADAILDGTARRRAEQLAALHGQRILLIALRAEVESALRRFASRGVGPAWRSEAQRRYAARRAELRDDLAGAASALDDAVEGVQAAIAELTAAG